MTAEIKPGADGYLRFSVKMDRTGVQVYPMDSERLGTLRPAEVVFDSSAHTSELQASVQLVRTLARHVNIPTERVDAAIDAELEREYERGRTTIARASPLDAIERVRYRISAGDSLETPLGALRELSVGYSPSTNPLVARLTEKFDRLGYEDPSGTAYAIARTVNRRRAGRAAR